MAVLPGSLDYLYYNGVLKRIPYEAYETIPMTASGSAQLSGLGTGYGINTNNTPMQMTGIQYLKNAQGGALYNTYTHPDVFVNRSNPNAIVTDKRTMLNKAFADGQGYGADLDYEVMTNGEDGKAVRKAVTNTVSKTANAFMDSPLWVKGLVAGSIMVATLCCMFSGKKAPTKELKEAVTKSTFWTKLNPVNWFKK